MPSGTTRRRKSESRLGQTPAWTQTTAALCHAMSEREALVAPEYVMDDYRQAMEAMASESVLYVQDGFVRFFHETFFDYSFARTFLNANNDLVQWLLFDGQRLFRRSQVPAGAGVLETPRIGPVPVFLTLKRLLEDTGIRFHIKRLVLDLLRALSDPTDKEWLVVEELTGQLDGHAWSVVHNSVPWFDVLQDMDRWKSWLIADEQQINRTMKLLQAT